MKTLFSLLSSILFVPFIFTTALGQSYNVPADDWSYDFLERMETKGVLKRVFDETRPMPREEMARAIQQVIEAAEGGDTRITSVDRAELEWLKREFWNELKRLGVEPGVQEERHLYKWEEKENHLIADVLFFQRATFRHSQGRTDRFLETSGGGVLRGGLRDELFFSAQFRQAQVNSNKSDLRKEDIDRKGYFSPRGDYGYYDVTNGYGLLKLPWFEFEVGKEALSWGPGVRGNLSLSMNGPPFDFIAFRARYGAIKYTHVTGFLKSDVIDSLTSYRTTDGFERENYSNKYLASHRLEITLPWGIDIGANEAIIYGERGLDVAYLNPFMFFWSAQHHWGDRDNETMGADIEIHAIDGYSFYGALFVDELYLRGFFNGDPRNKIGFLLGTYIVDPLSLENLDLRFEYAKVMPAVYSHKFPINTYIHYDEVLGHWLGENGDDLYFEGRYRTSRELQFQLFAGRTRSGEPAPQPEAHYDPNRFPFLFGTVERTNYFGCRIYYQPAHKLRFVFDYTYRAIENDNQNPGADRRENELTVRLNLDY
ncbi:MAG: capsule assembly Wzi family protein [bacterium]